MTNLTMTLKITSTQVVSLNQQQQGNSPSQDYTNPDNQPNTNVSNNQQQSFSGLHQPRRSTNYKRQSQPTTVLLRTTPTQTINQPQTSVTTNNSPSQDYTNPDDQPTTNVSYNQQQSFSEPHQPRRSTNYKRQSQPTTVLLRTTPTQTINQLQTSVTTKNGPSQDYTNPDDQPTTNVSLNQQQPFSGLHQPRRSTNHKRQSQPTTVLLRTTHISETSVTFLDINISVQDNKLATSVHYKPTDSHSYLLYSSSHPSHVKDSIPYSQFLRLRRLCSKDSDFNSKCDEMSNFFSERGYPDSILSKALNRVQNVNRESALESSASDNEERIPFTLTFHPNNLAARNVVLRNFKILQSDPETAPIFPNPPLVSFKRDRNLRNSLVRSSLPSNLEPGTFNCSRKVCNTCPFISSKTHIRGPNGSYQVNDHFDCTTSNIIYCCITCTLCNKLYIGESGRKLGDCFREHLLDVKNKGSDLSKPVARHFNLPGHSHEHMEICGIYLHLGNNETRKRREQRLIFKLGTLAPNGINERFLFA